MRKPRLHKPPQPYDKVSEALKIDPENAALVNSFNGLKEGDIFTEDAEGGTKVVKGIISSERQGGDTPSTGEFYYEIRELDSDKRHHLNFKGFYGFLQNDPVWTLHKTGDTERDIRLAKFKEFTANERARDRLAAALVQEQRERAQAVAKTNPLGFSGSE